MKNVRWSLVALAAFVFASSLVASPPPQAPLPLSDLALPEVCLETPGTLEALELVPIFPPDYIQCTCKRCGNEPYIECQISPDGYSILCADWFRLHC